MSTVVAAKKESLLAKRIVLTTVLGLGLIAFLAPFYWLVVASTHKSSDIFTKTPRLLPGSYLLENIRGLFSSTDFASALVNSVLIASIYTVLGIFVCSISGYAFAKYNFRGKGVLFALVLATLALPGQVTLIPLFKIMLRLDWLNSYQALILPGLALPFGIFLMRQTMKAIPDEMIQAGRIDGAGELRIFFRLVLPTMKPALAALAIFLFLAQWNDFVYPLVIMREPTSYTIPVALASLQGIGSTDYGQLLAGTLISVLPILALFLFLQRHFVAGILSGAVKQ